MHQQSFLVDSSMFSMSAPTRYSLPALCCHKLVQLMGKNLGNLIIASFRPCFSICYFRSKSQYSFILSYLLVYLVQNMEEDKDRINYQISTSIYFSIFSEPLAGYIIYILLPGQENAGICNLTHYHSMNPAAYKICDLPLNELTSSASILSCQSKTKNSHLILFYSECNELIICS